MHTAFQLKKELFTVEVDGQAASPEDLLPDWGPLDRFGIVVHEPFGGIGASYLIQLAITMWYDVRPDRRDKAKLLYPDFYLIHAGGPHGAHTYYDLFPTRKEVFVENTPMAVLRAINDRGITRLAVPDRPVEYVQHEYKEPRQADDRITSVWAYSPTGRVDNADVRISSSSRAAETNTKLNLFAEESYDDIQQAIAAQSTKNGIAPRLPNELSRRFPNRDHEVSREIRERIRDQRTLLEVDGVRSETYRRITLADALGMLHHGPAPAFEESEELLG